MPFFCTIEGQDVIVWSGACPTARTPGYHRHSTSEIFLPHLEEDTLKLVEKENKVEN